MFKKIKEFFVGKPAEVPTLVAEVVSAPYKLPEPPAVTPIPLVVEVVAPVAAEVVAPVAAEVVAPVAVKAPRKPRTPKVVAAVVPAKAVKAVKEKAPAKAKASNVVAMKAPKKATSKKV